jgi:hypothetical protein
MIAREPEESDHALGSGLMQTHLHPKLTYFQKYKSA